MTADRNLRILKGRGNFLNDIRLPGLCHVAFVRSPYAHARIVSVPRERILQLPGVRAVFTGTDLRDRVKLLPRVPPLYDSLIPRIQPTIRPPMQRALALDRARHVGEAVAAIVADSPVQAEDAVQQIAVEYEPLPAVVDPEQAVAPGAPLLFEEWGDNVAVRYSFRMGKVDEAFRSAPHRLSDRFYFHRHTANPMEPRGTVATWDSSSGKLKIWSSTQVPFPLRDHLAETLGLERRNVQVITPDVGGGFGTKSVVYPEEIATAYLAMALGTPVKWIEHRREHMLASVHGRDQIQYCEIAFDEEGTIAGLRLRLIGDSGAYSPYHLNPTFNTISHLPGPYKVGNYEARVLVAVTNKTPTAPYRGAGRPEAVQVMEQLMERIARHLEQMPHKVRLKNMITAPEMPFDTGRLYKDGERIVYDGGDYPRCLDLALATVGHDAFRREQKRGWSENRYLGLGMAPFVEGTAQGPEERARLRIDADGSIHCFVSTPSQGQGHDTVFPALCAEVLGGDPGCIRCHAEDTEALAGGRGTYGSRSAVLTGSAVYLAASRVRQMALQRVARRRGTDPKSLQIQAGGIVCKSGPETMVPVTYRELARESPLEAEGVFTPEQCTYAYGVHALTLEVFPETGRIEILKYVVCDDAGRLLNPQIADGQIRGGVAQGIGGALFEELIYDENGQLLTGSFNDYAMPKAYLIPEIEIVHLSTPSPRNPIGARGLGEAGAIPCAAAIANAVEDALQPLGVRINRLPLSPPRLWEAIRQAGTGKSGAG